MLNSVAGILVVAPLLAAATDGQVLYIANKDVYLDAGAEEGVTMGQELKLTRRNKPVGPCEVVEVSVKKAVCRSDRAAPGDRFSFAFVPPPVPPEAEPKKLPPMMPAGQQRELREIVEQAPIAMVKHEVIAGGILASGRTTLRQEVWGVSTTPGGVFARSSLDAAVRAGFGTAPHFFAAGAARVVGDFIAPNNQRGRPGELVELYVWGLSVGMREGLVVGELGRFYAKNVPGVLLLDGAQAGVRFLEDTTEVGVYAGAIPDLIATGPSLDRLAAGTYFGMTLQPGEGISILPRARLGVVSKPDFTVIRGELCASTEVFWRGIGSVGGTVRSGYGGTADMLPSLDGATADFSLGVLPELTLMGTYRYTGQPPVDLDLAANGAVARVQGGHDLSGRTGYTLGPWLSLGAMGGAAWDTVTGTTRAFVGPELGVPQAFGDLGGIQVGYVEELGLDKVDDAGAVKGNGWPGRSAYASARVAFPFLSVSTRASYYESAALTDWYRELGLYALVDAPILPWLSLRARLYGQQALPTLNGTLRSLPTGGMADLALTGSL